MKNALGVRFLILAALMNLILLNSAHAHSGVSGAAGGLKDPSSLTGLCTTGNSNQRWVKDGWCGAIRDSFMNKCKEKFGHVFDNLESSGLKKDFNQYCPGFDKIATDPLKFSIVLEQLSAALFIEESEWETGARGDRGRSQGISQISLKVAKTPAYSCGCSDIKKQSDINDGKKNSACGASIMIHWLDKQVYKQNTLGANSVIGGGPAGKPGQSKGLANYFGPFGDRQQDKRARIMKKLKNWCQKTSGADGLPGGQANATK